jgi:hypothetical protein
LNLHLEVPLVQVQYYQLRWDLSDLLDRLDLEYLEDLQVLEYLVVLLDQSDLE